VDNCGCHIWRLLYAATGKPVRSLLLKNVKLV